MTDANQTSHFPNQYEIDAYDAQWKMKQAAQRAHKIVYKLSQTFKGLHKWLGDEGQLHQAIHEILAVDTPFAKPKDAVREEPNA